MAAVAVAAATAAPIRRRFRELSESCPGLRGFSESCYPGPPPACPFQQGPPTVVLLGVLFVWVVLGMLSGLSEGRLVVVWGLSGFSGGFTDGRLLVVYLLWAVF